MLRFLAALWLVMLAATSPALAALHVRHRTGLASWHGAEDGGRQTADGRAFDPNGLTAAHRTLPLGTCVQVRNLANGRAVTVRINDRGPYMRGRVIDLSERAAAEIGMKHKGVARVRLHVVSKCPEFAATQAGAAAQRAR